MRLFSREMACQELVELVTAYFDGSLSRRDRRRFDAHIRGCEHCTAYVEQMRLLIAATGRLTEEDIPSGAREDLLAAFRGWSEGRPAVSSRRAAARSGACTAPGCGCRGSRRGRAGGPPSRTRRPAPDLR